jgi:threonyl-tRNA synthetase
MCMNDGHIYCEPQQVEAEIDAVLDMHERLYGLLGIDGYRYRLSRRAADDPRRKYVDDPDSWRAAEALLERALARRGLAFTDGAGHAAFYGPKIDVQVRAHNGVEETLSTVQIDFAQPRRLGLQYTAAGGRLATPLCIHRAPFSTHERFVAYLLELYGGAFPPWLAPVQVAVVPVGAAARDYAAAIVTRLRAKFVRAELGSTSDTVAKNVRAAAARKIPVVLVVGRREHAESRVSVRLHGSATQSSVALDVFEHELLRTIARRERRYGAAG